MTVQEFIDELRSLDQDNIGSWPMWAYIGAIVIVAAVVLLLGSWYFVFPKQGELAQAQRQEKTLRTKFARQHEQVAHLDAYKKQLADMQKTFGTLLRQLPSKTEVPKLLNDISQTLVASGLKEKLFKPEQAVKKDFYAILPNDLVVTGTYHELGKFVSGVAALPRIVTLNNVSIQPIKTDGRFNGKLHMSVVANTYRYLNGDESSGK